MNDPVTEYASKVLEGDIPAGPYVIWACERHFRDLERDDIWLDLEEVRRRVNFFKLLKHWKGKGFAGTQFLLSPWQIFRIGSAFGWRRRNTGLRRFTEVYTEVPRKNGKTTEAAGIGLMGMLLDNEPGAEVYAVATKRDQAKIVWNDAKQMAAASPPLAKRINGYVSNLSCISAASKFEPLGRDSKTLDGLNPYYVVYDEYHAYRDPNLRAVIQNGLGSRDDPLEWVITTAGTDPDTVCYELHEHAVRMLDPELPDFDDDELFAYIACPFPDDDPGSPETWQRANPNLNGAKKIAYMERQWKRATQRPSERNEFLIKQLNIWTEAADAWLPFDKVKAAMAAAVDPATLLGRPCFAGLDLAQVNDLSALALVFPFEETDAWPVLMYYWCPQNDIRNRAKNDKVPYDLWAREGHLTPTPGNATDYNYIEAAIKKIADQYELRELLYDRWQAHQLITNLTNDGLTTVPYGQGYKDASPALNEIERRLISGQLALPDNPVLRWNATNAQVIRDPAGNIKLNKKDPRKRIDGIAALANAIGGARIHTEETVSVYEGRGLLEL